MTLRTLIEMKADGTINWQSPSIVPNSPVTSYYYGLSPISTLHPPSLRNPQEVKVPTAQDGFKYGDPEEAKEQAMQDLVEIHKRLRRQTGKPEIAHTAAYPIFPSMNIR